MCHYIMCHLYNVSFFFAIFYHLLMRTQSFQLAGSSGNIILVSVNSIYPHLPNFNLQKAISSTEQKYKKNYRRYGNGEKT